MAQVIPPEDLKQLQAQFAQAQATNAVKFTPQAEQMTVALTQRGTHAQIQVTGTGKGIKPDFLSQQIRALEQTKQVLAMALTAYTISPNNCYTRSPLAPLNKGGLGVPSGVGGRWGDRICLKDIGNWYYAGEFDRQFEIAAGFQRHLAKPVVLAEIVRLVTRLRGRKGGNVE